MNELSQQGIARREQILLLARGEARRRRRRRTLGRGAVTLVIFTMAFALMLLRHSQPATRPQLPIAKVTPPAPTSSSEPSFQLSLAGQYVQTDPTITDRLTIQAEPAKWTSIDDHELLSELAAAGQPAGIVSVHGKTLLLMR